MSLAGELKEPEQRACEVRIVQILMFAHCQLGAHAQALGFHLRMCFDV